jgi:transposase-like protein
VTKPFSLAFKQKMMACMTGNDAVSARQLALEPGRRQQTLSRWLQEASSLSIMPAKRPRRDWSIEEKIRVLAKASTRTGAELTDFRQREGVRPAEYEQWRRALGEEGRASLATLQRMRTLERELARKAQALTDAAAALNEAETAGARLRDACPVIGGAVRTIQRWKRHPDADDGRCGPRHRPGNARSAREETEGLARLTSAEYGHRSPKQLVPRLADEGRYLASESTMSRLRRRVGWGARRRSTLRLAVARATTVHRAVRSNQVWSWDITSLPPVFRGRVLRLSLVMDVWSRRIVGGDVHDDESAERAATH